MQEDPRAEISQKVEEFRGALEYSSDAADEHIEEVGEASDTRPEEKP